MALNSLNLNLNLNPRGMINVVNLERSETNDIGSTASNIDDTNIPLPEFGKPDDVFLLADSDDESEDDYAEISLEELKQNLAEWAVQCKIPHSSLGDLLKILRMKIPGLPKDPRTLLGTVTSIAQPQEILVIFMLDRLTVIFVFCLQTEEL